MVYPHQLETLRLSQCLHKVPLSTPAVYVRQNNANGQFSSVKIVPFYGKWCLDHTEVFANLSSPEKNKPIFERVKIFQYWKKNMWFSISKWHISWKSSKLWSFKFTSNQRVRHQHKPKGRCYLKFFFFIFFKHYVFMTWHFVLHGFFYYILLLKQKKNQVFGFLSGQ